MPVPFKVHLQQSYWVFGCESCCGFGEAVGEKKFKSKMALLPHLETDILGEQQTCWVCCSSIKNNVEQKTLRDSMNTHLCTLAAGSM